jgi:hypothetical protein
MSFISFGMIGKRSGKVTEGNAMEIVARDILTDLRYTFKVLV